MFSWPPHVYAPRQFIIVHISRRLFRASYIQLLVHSEGYGFWVVTPCSWERDRRFEGTHLKLASFFSWFFALVIV
jgi:hypothetical protein